MLAIIPDNVRRVISILEDVQSDITNVVVKHQQARAEIEDYKKTIETLQKKNAALESSYAALEKVYKETCDEVEAMKKVSHIIAVERENSRLRIELESFKKNIVRACSNPPAYKHAVNMQSVITPPAPSQPVIYEDDNDHDYDIDDENDNNAIEPEDDDDATESDEVAVYEKKFNKKPYYVSDDDKMIIYEILPNGGIGVEVGHCVKDANNKLKPVWNA